MSAVPHLSEAAANPSQSDQGSGLARAQIGDVCGGSRSLSDVSASSSTLPAVSWEPTEQQARGEADRSRVPLGSASNR